MPEIFSSSTDRYAVEREYAHGGMGMTYLVRSGTTGERLILKQLRLDRVSDWKMVELFEREAEVLRQLNHPQIPRYVDYFPSEDKKQFCLVQSFIEGRTLQQLIDAQSPMDGKTFEAYFIQCLNILVYLHGLVPPVVHRDITPKNIIVHDGNAYLVDFGSVKSAIAPSRESLATSVGTFGYMPPEQIMGRAVPASDVFSLAMTFIALGSHSDPSLLPLDNSSGQVDVRRILGHLPRAIVDVLEEMTAMGLEKRLGIAQFVIDRLKRPVSASRSTSPKTSRDADHSHNDGKISAIRMKPSGRLISMIGGGLLILIVILFSSSGSDSETKQGGSVTKNPVPVQKENTPKVKTVRLLTHIPSTTLQRILTATEWTGHDGQSEARLVFKKQGVSVIGELTEWDRRKKEFSGQRTAVAVQITDQGTLWMTARRINEGVTIDDTFYGNLTEDSLMITGTGEKLYRQSGSEYTTEFKWQFKRSIP